MNKDLPSWVYMFPDIRTFYRRRFCSVDRHSDYTEQFLFQLFTEFCELFDNVISVRTICEQFVYKSIITIMVMFQADDHGEPLVNIDCLAII